MKSVPLTAYPRTIKGRSGVAKLRTGGRVPAVIYGEESESQSLEVVRKELQHLTHHTVSENLLVDLEVEGEGKKRLVLLQEVQHNHLTGEVLHVDFHEVSETKKVTVTIPIETVGEAQGVKTGGGTLEHVLFKVRVRALPRDLPEFLQIDVTDLDVGGAIHVSDIPAMEGVEILGDPHITVVSVMAPRTEKEPGEEIAEGAAQPEMIKEKKEGAK